MRTHTYFISDMHLGLDLSNPVERERKVVRWLDSIKSSAKRIYLMGDVFDFWWEYKCVIPKGFVRFLGKLAELTDGGVEIHYFVGNHDQWAKDYLHAECGVIMHHKGEVVNLDGKIFYLAHGHKVTQPLQRLFASTWLQRFFSMLHPRWAMALGNAWSKRNRIEKGLAENFGGREEPLYKVAEKIISKQEVDFIVLGHRHAPAMRDLPGGTKLVVLSDWITGSTYADFDGEQLELKIFEEDKRASHDKQINASR